MIAAIFIFLILFPFLQEPFIRTSYGDCTRSRAFYILTPLVSVALYTIFALITSLPLLSLALYLLIFTGFAAISNTKERVLKMPFVLHDFENLRHLRIYPEFYIAYVGSPILIFLSLLFAGLVIAAYMLETPYAAMQSSIPPVALWGLGIGALWVSVKVGRNALLRWMQNKTPEMFDLTLDPCRDVARHGMYGALFLYGLCWFIPHKKLPAPKEQDEDVLPASSQYENNGQKLADLIAIQGESFFDLNRYFSTDHVGSGESWETLNRLAAAGVHIEAVDVPAWGAYTMQTEFSFLTGCPIKTLGVDFLNPYIRTASTPVQSIAHKLKAMGYKTVCIHPAKKEFYRRDTVIPNLGFDEFIDLQEISDPQYFGPYVSDACLTDTIEQVISGLRQNSDQPIFIFAISIESHGPWLAGRLAEHIDEAAAMQATPSDDQEFSLYQVHMDNLMGMFDRLSIQSSHTDRPRLVAMYGDHMPALGPAFDRAGFSDIATNYLVWHSDKPVDGVSRMDITAFGDFLLKTLRT
ncbi:capsular polysaccharide biosynthesis protein [Kordiimonas sediminis]|uniref:Capsular polysaccharide biosynthesis protein n=1 Tax=Kordiimonas sediminis TaxID=1735581 RepID=A0A919AQF3_9PROT|nr:LTA synthase family protein [Kordiimonas sediminis]GHF18366.1 capsular polysaccharide biosynthesis protein [Kordiimonas sediminis]